MFRSNKIYVVAVIGVVAIILGVLGWPFAVQGVEYLKPQPEKFTELYFAEHTTLPKKVTYDTDYPFTFVLHNLEHRDMKYRYEISITSDQTGESRIIDKSSVSVLEDEFKPVKEQFQLPSGVTRAKITVNLPDKDQKIHFWVESIE